MILECSKLRFLETIDLEGIEFYAEDLSSIANQEGTHGLILKRVRCDAQPHPPATIHPAVIAQDSSGNELLDGFYAALPCPPHCGGKGIIKFEDFTF